MKLRRVSVIVSAATAEEARARLLELFPEGFEEVEAADRVELVAYTDAAGEERLRSAFERVVSTYVQDDWHDRWREFHRPARAGPFWVGPPWEPQPRDAVVVVIDPGLAFGTGAHPTTRLCLELLAETPPASLVDVGCGSGVLAIAAAKLGFGPVIALDSDPAAVDAARANAERNGVAVDVRRVDALRDSVPTCTVAVANLSLEAVELLAPGLSARWLIASGYLGSDDPALLDFERRERRVEDGWAADVFERPA